MKWLLLLGGLSACASPVGMGDTCEKPEQCGKGADCYHGLCTPMCATDAECQGELVCARHHCLQASGEPRRSTAAPANGSPDVVAELRAIRSDLQQLRAEQGRLREAIEKLDEKVFASPP